MSHDIETLKGSPAPVSAQALNRKAGYRTSVRIDHDGAMANERCVDARAIGLAGANHYACAYNPPYHHRIPGAIEALFVRRTVATRLLQVNARLAPAGLELFLFDAWRPKDVQAYFHGVWFPKWLSDRRPELKGEALRSEVERYWSAPSDGEDSPAPHATGGAVDLTLIHRDTQQPLFMGGIFDDVTAGAWTDAFEQSAPISMSDEEARANRRLLYWVMAEAGFANNPTEWWHYSWGDQMWAKMTGHDAAHYGAYQPAGSSGL